VESKCSSLAETDDTLLGMGVSIKHMVFLEEKSMSCHGSTAEVIVSEPAVRVFRNPLPRLTRGSKDVVNDCENKSFYYLSTHNLSFVDAVWSALFRGNMELIYQIVKYIT
jgi:hypothetical protein